MTEGQIQERDVTPDRFRVETSSPVDYGRGEVQLVQVLPDDIASLSDEERKKIRLLIYVQPYNPSGKHELAKLEEDLKILAESTQGAEPVRVVGVAFTGSRDVNSGKLIDAVSAGLPEGTRVTQLQRDKALDMVAAIQDLIDGNNAEIVGYSAGGPVAQLAHALGLPVDRVGLFNTSGLDNKNYWRTAGRVLLESGKSLIMDPFFAARDLRRYGRKRKIVFGEEPERSLIDRVGRSFGEHLSVGKAKTHQLVGASAETQFVIGNTRFDWLYPRRRIQKVLTQVGAQNVSYVPLQSWGGHDMGWGRRREKLSELGKVMMNARTK